jgi:hypothetical protein
MTIRETASVTVSKPVSGKRRRRAYPVNVTTRATTTYSLKVDPRVMTAARSAMRPGQHLVIVSETCVRLVNDED